MIGPSLKLPLCFNFSEEFQMHTFHTVFVFIISLVPPNRSNVHPSPYEQLLLTFPTFFRFLSHLLPFFVFSYTIEV